MQPLTYNYTSQTTYELTSMDARDTFLKDLFRTGVTIQKDSKPVDLLLATIEYIKNHPENFEKIGGKGDVCNLNDKALLEQLTSLYSHSPNKTDDYNKPLFELIVKVAKEHLPKCKKSDLATMLSGISQAGIGSFPISQYNALFAEQQLKVQEGTDSQKPTLSEDTNGNLTLDLNSSVHQITSAALGINVTPPQPITLHTQARLPKGQKTATIDPCILRLKESKENDLGLEQNRILQSYQNNQEFPTLCPLILFSLKGDLRSLLALEKNGALKDDATKKLIATSCCEAYNKLLLSSGVDRALIEYVTEKNTPISQEILKTSERAQQIAQQVNLNKQRQALYKDLKTDNTQHLESKSLELLRTYQQNESSFSIGKRTVANILKSPHSCVSKDTIRNFDCLAIKPEQTMINLCKLYLQECKELTHGFGFFRNNKTIAAAILKDLQNTPETCDYTKIIQKQLQKNPHLNMKGSLVTMLTFACKYHNIDIKKLLPAATPQSTQLKAQPSSIDEANNFSIIHSLK